MSRHTSSLLHFWQTIVVMAAIGLLLGVLLSFLRPLEYSSTARLLIIQQLGTVDAYTASRSAERVAEDITNVIYTSTFFQKVMSSTSQIDQSYFPDDEIKLRKMWGRTVDAIVTRGTGLLTLVIYHTDVRQADLIARALASVIVTEGWQYTSGGSISIQLVDEPLSSRWPVRPSIPLNAFAGAVLGGLSGVGFVLLKAERIRRRHQLVHD